MVIVVFQRFIFSFLNPTCNILLQAFSTVGEQSSRSHERTKPFEGGRVPPELDLFQTRKQRRLVSGVLIN
ncbi:hypothetical protein VCHA54P500_230049 [Vibrio chagasii]|nr:hypothetical protein VCHA48P439_230005 [Vibrio chagasii]CAH7085742.1 hypothetical protein VCHA40O236_230049 [Vibrio chagasii]CAH7138429.1 hypothetical protein VCHA54P500_230049 [Vibrio chagasii]